MKYYAAFLKMNDPEKNRRYSAEHKDFLLQKEGEGKIFARGRFTDGGGLVIYMAESMDEARSIAESDPYVVTGARVLELYEWDMKVAPRP